MGGAVALYLANHAAQVSYVTTAGNASAWTFMTNELPLIHRALHNAGVRIHTLQRVTAFGAAEVTLSDVHSGRETRHACRSLVIVGMRKPRLELYESLSARGSDLKDAGIGSLTRIGDSLAPGAIVHAVHSGHRYAREFDGSAPGTAAANESGLPYARDFPV